MGESLKTNSENNERVLPRKERVEDITPIVSLAVELAGSIDLKGPVDNGTNAKRRDLTRQLAGVGILKEDFGKWPTFYDQLFNPATKEKLSEIDIDVAMLSYLKDILKARGIKTIYRKSGEKEKKEEKMED